MAQNSEKWGILLWIFAEGREIGGVYVGVYWSVIGHRLKVGATGGKGKAQEWCNACGSGWKCGKDGQRMGMPPVSLCIYLRDRSPQQSFSTGR
jgi:hypothetical protein